MAPDRSAHLGIKASVGIVLACLQGGRAACGTIWRSIRTNDAAVFIPKSTGPISKVYQPIRYLAARPARAKHSLAVTGRGGASCLLPLAVPTPVGAVPNVQAGTNP